MDLYVNYIAVFLATIVSTVLGFVWYSPFLFGKPWMKLMGYTADSLKKAQKEMGPMYAVSFVVTLVMAYVLSHLMSLSIKFYGYTPMMTAFVDAFFAWIGFVMPVQVTDVLFGKKQWQLFYINTGFQLVSLLAIGVVLALMW